MPSLQKVVVMTRVDPAVRRALREAAYQSRQSVNTLITRAILAEIAKVPSARELLEPSRT